MSFDKDNFDIFALGEKLSEEDFFRVLDNIEHYKDSGIDWSKIFMYGVPIQKPDVLEFVNEHRDFIEIDIFYYKDKISAYAILSDDKPPWRDFCGVGEHRNDKEIAVTLAIKDLNRQAY